MVFANYSETVKDDFEDEACVHCFDVTHLVLDDLGFINYFISLDFGEGCFEVTTCEGKVILIKYITFENKEFDKKFISEIEHFINEQMASYFSISGTAYFH
jgi:hypothetical protein